MEKLTIRDQDSENLSFLKKTFLDCQYTEIKLIGELYGIYTSLLTGAEIRLLAKNNYVVTRIYPLSNSLIKVVVRKDEGD